VSSPEALVLFQPKKLGYIQKLASVKTFWAWTSVSPVFCASVSAIVPGCSPLRNAWLTWRDDD